MSKQYRSWSNNNIGLLMRDILIQHYLIIKALHIIFIICWIAGLLYLPRLFVYHATAKHQSELYSVLLLMERRLLKIIMLPSIFGSFLFGLLLIYIIGTNHIWLHVKLLFTFLLAGIHGLFSIYWKQFKTHSNTKSPHFFRIINEIPAIIMIIIVILAILKPL